jgi:uncharacterized delta-60 repeat protein
MKKIFFFVVCFFITNNVISQNITLDTSFGTNGVLELPYERLIANGSIYGVGGYGHSVLLNSGKILVLQGGQINGQTRSYLTRINNDGTIDTSFGDNGYAIFNYYTSYTFSIRIQNDNKIVIYGAANPVKLYRFLENGQPDLSFGTNGLIQIYGGFSADSYGLGGERQNLVLLPDGKILIRYKYEGGINLGYKLKCFNTDGTPNNSFGTNSEIFSTSASSTFVSEFLFNSIDNKIIGFRSVNGGGYIVEKFNLDGTKDSSYGDNGKLIVPLPFTSFTTNSITQDQNYNLVIQSLFLENSIYKMRQVRLDPNGVLDATFGNGGVITEIGFPNAYLSAPVFYNNKYYFTGGFLVENSYELNSQIIVSTNNDGTLNTNFNNIGSYIENSNTLPYGEDILIQNDGKIIIIGGYTGNATTRMYVKRYIDSILTNQKFSQSDVSFTNPVGENLIFKSTKQIKAVLIYNAFGQKIIESNSEAIVTADFTKGIYLVTIHFVDDTFATKKIIKN